MIVNHKYKFIFIKTRKTAGTSIEIALSEYCQKGDIVTTLLKEDERERANLGFQGPQNYKLPFFKYKRGDWVDFFDLSKPNPFYRRHADCEFIKTYLDETIWNNYYKFCFERNPFDRAISRYYWKTRSHNPKPELNEYIQSNQQHMLSNWSKYTINNEIVVDFVGSYENLEADLLHISNQLNLPKLELPNAKGNTRNNREHYSRILNSKTRAHIEALCANEIEHFGYHWTEQ